MKTFISKVKKPEFSYEFPQEKEKILFFDIETTGLSKEVSSLYLIGAMYYDNTEESFMEIQWFADRHRDEKTMLLAFLELLEKYDYLYHFNGKTFDIPYVLFKCRRYEIRLSEHAEKILKDDSGKKSIDILARVRKLKKFLSLEKCSQTSLEKFLRLDRKDQFSGGELIPVYAEYMQLRLLEPEKAEALEKLLLLHNHDDVEMMLSVCAILSYEVPLKETSLSFLSAQIAGQNETKHLLLSFSYPCEVPKEIRSIRYYPETDSLTATLELKGNLGFLHLPLYTGTLKYFFPDYKNYYYLPAEDTAIHKSVSEFVKKEHRKQATASTCYTKREGVFFPSLIPKTKAENSSQTPLFFRNYKEKPAFYELPKDLNHTDRFFTKIIEEQLTMFL